MSNLLFYKNIPSVGKRKSTKLMHMKNACVDITFLSNVETPFYIFIGNSTIHDLENKKFEEKIINKLNKTGLNIYLNEPISWRINKEHNCIFYSVFNSNENIELFFSDELDSIQKFVKNNKLRKVKVFTCDYQIDLVKNKYPELQLFCLDIFIRSAASRRKKLVGQNKKIINKKFWCANWRYNDHRHLITSYLTQYSAKLSWHINCSSERLNKIQWFDLQDCNAETLEKIKTGAKLLEHQTFSIDMEVNSLSDNHIALGFFSPGGNAPEQSYDLITSQLDCFCCIINETRFAQPFSNFSEKTLYAVISQTPFIVVAPPYTLQYFKKFGFKTFDKWWDESYDTEEDHQKRLLKIFDLIEYINGLSIDSLYQIYEEMQNVFQHNVNVLQTLPMNDKPISMIV